MENTIWQGSSTPSNNGAVQEARCDYWVNVWRDHGQATRGCDPQQQVMRTHAGQLLASDQLAAIDSDIFAKMDLREWHQVADVGCGSGRFTRLMAQHCRNVHAFDVSEDLLASWEDECPPNVVCQVTDLRDIDFARHQFDRVLVYAVMQYLSDKETITFLQQLVRGVAAGGFVLLGDLPDCRRLWTFFNTPERQHAYFHGLVAARPIIGTWFDPNWLTRAARFAGFSDVRILPQAEHLPYAHFRFDALLFA